MDAASQTEGDQTRLWNGSAGRAWVDAQGLLDQVLKPLEDLLGEAILAKGLAPNGKVLDIGCGTGGTTLALARHLGSNGQCVGIDISAPMIVAAQARAARDGVPATFIRADAQTYAFELASFDVITSRFGVMFFDDPVQAFANLRRAAKQGAELRFIAWRGAAENPFMTTAERIAAPLLPNMPARDPSLPGQFAFADALRVHTVLAQSGWTDINIRPIDVACAFPEKDLVRYLSRLGPVGRALEEADDSTRARVIETVRPAFDPYVRGAEVRFTAACWIVDARAMSSQSA